MMAVAFTLAGRYRLETLVRPGVDPSTWRAIDTKTDHELIVCLVDRVTLEAVSGRCRWVHPSLSPILDILELAKLDPETLPRQLNPAAVGFVILPNEDGVSLEGMVAERGAMEPTQAVATIAYLAEALQSLHEHNQIHGGVVPDAVLVRENEDTPPRLGLRGMHDEAVAYMSPNRLCDDVLSEADDAWALLGCLYFTVSGTHPFTGPSRQALSRRVLGGRPAPIKKSTPALTGLQELFNQGFSRVINDRFSNVRELHTALMKWTSEFGRTSLPPPNVTSHISGSDMVKRPSTGPDQPTSPQLERPTLPKQKLHENEAGNDENTVRFSREEVESMMLSGAGEGASGLGGLLRAKAAEKAEAKAEQRRQESAVQRPVPSFDDVTVAKSIEDVHGAPTPPRMPVAARVAESEVGVPKATQPEPQSKVPAAEPAPDVSSTLPGSVQEAGQRPSKSPNPKRPWLMVSLVSLVVIVLGGGSLVWYQMKDKLKGNAAHGKPVQDPSAVPAKATKDVPATSTSVTGTPKVAPPSSSPAAGSSSPVVSSAPVPTGKGALEQCVLGVFREDAFPPETDFSFVCSENNAQFGVGRVSKAVMSNWPNKKGQSQAQREWPVLNWFQLAAFAAVQRKCCPGSPTTHLISSASTCVPLEKSLQAIAERAQKKGDPMDDVIQEYRKTIMCLSTARPTGIFGHSGQVRPDEETTFRVFVKRLRSQ
jgi:serine/threonine protein kinase